MLKRKFNSEHMIREVLSESLIEHIFGLAEDIVEAKYQTFKLKPYEYEGSSRQHIEHSGSLENKDREYLLGTYVFKCHKPIKAEIGVNVDESNLIMFLSSADMLVPDDKKKQ